MAASVAVAVTASVAVAALIDLKIQLCSVSGSWKKFGVSSYFHTYMDGGNFGQVKICKG